MKPKMRRIAPGAWTCSTEQCRAFGFTPLEAYEAWEAGQRCAATAIPTTYATMFSLAMLRLAKGGQHAHEGT